MTSEDEIRRILSAIPDPVTGEDLVAAGRISGIVARGGRAGVVLAIDGLKPETAQSLEAGVGAALRTLAGIEEARVILTAERGAAPGGARRPDPHPVAAAILPNVRRIVAVASGKGGVGKSTVAVNLAVALAAAGQRVGLLDADIYGPSVPMLIGSNARAGLSDGRIQPAQAHGIKAVSMGMMADPDKAMVWRGPMAASAMMQMLTQTDWGELDTLVIDLPPGTGDIQLTMAQKAPVNGAVIVSTPQDLALIDARKAIAMFGKVGIPVIGMIENMSSFQCPSCGHEAHIFGNGGAMDTSLEIGVPFLGSIPLAIDIRASGDAGLPVALGTDAAGAAFRGIASRIVDLLEERR